MEVSGEHCPKTVSLWMSRRLVVGWFLFFANFLFFTMRVNMNLTIVCMVNHTALLYDSSGEIHNNKTFECEGRNGSDTIQANQDGTFVWDRSRQAMILGAYFWPYAIFQVPAGILALKIGAYKLIGFSVSLMSLFTILIPVLSPMSYTAIIVLRGLIGFVSSSNLVGCQYLLSRWVPVHERSRLSSLSFLGGDTAFIISYVTAGFLCKYGFDGGWPSVFYIHGGGGLLFAVLWFALMSDAPENARGISESEKEYIQKHIQRLDNKESEKRQRKIPWKRILTSLPVYAMTVALSASDWSVTFMETYVPTYLDDLFFFDVDTIGIISALPNVFVMIVTLFGGMSSDYIQKRCLSRCNTRKLYTAVSMIIPASLMLALGYVSCSRPTLSITLMTLSYSIRGFRYAGVFENALEIDPQNSSVIFGLANTASNISGFLTSVMVGGIIENSTREEWRYCFYISAAIDVFGALFYLVFAKSHVQLKKDIDIKPEDPEIS